MQWTVRLTVALLNILWVVFFLTPDPFSVSVQRRSARSSEEETLFHEFCVAPEPHMTSSPHSVNITTNKTNSTDTAAEVIQESNFTAHEVHSIKTNIQHDCQCNYTNIPPTDWSSSHSEIRPPAPGCEPMMIVTFPNMEVCMDAKLNLSATTPFTTDREETAAVSPPPVPELTPAASPPVQGPASSEVTAASGLTATSTSAAPLYTAPHHPRTTVQQKDKQGQRRELSESVNQESNFTAHEVHSIKTNIQHDCQCNYTNIPPTDWSSSHSEIRPPAPGCEPMMIVTFPNMEVCMDAKLNLSATTPFTTDREETAAVSPPPVPELTPAASPPVQGPASSEVTAASGLTATSTSAAPLYTAPHHPRTTVQQKDKQGQRRELSESDPIHLDCCFKFYPRRMNKNLIKSYFLTAARCPKPAVVLVSLKSRHICADPNLSWVKNIMKSVDARSF